MAKICQPVPAGLYCLNCRYELRGLTECRCPECGREFDLARPETMSLYRSRKEETMAAIDHRVAKWMGTIGGAGDRVMLARLTAHIAHLMTENDELRTNLASIARLLVEKNVISEAELHERVDRVDLREASSVNSDEQIAEWLGQMSGGGEKDATKPQ